MADVVILLKQHSQYLGLSLSRNDVAENLVRGNNTLAFIKEIFKKDCRTNNAFYKMFGGSEGVEGENRKAEGEEWSKKHRLYPDISYIDMTLVQLVEIMSLLL